MSCRRLIWPGLLALVAVLGLVSLGTWQLERKAWKDHLIATLSKRLNATPTALPPSSTWMRLDRQELDFSPVALVGEFLNDREALVYTAGSRFRPDVTGPGYWVFTPARVADGGLLLVNRGFVPEGRQDPASRREGELRGELTISGVMRWPDAPGMFTPRHDAARRLFFARDPLAIAEAENLGTVAPFYVEAQAPRPPGGWPSPGPLTVNLPNNHLQYAVTWYALAAGLVGVFMMFAASHRAAPSRPQDA